MREAVIVIGLNWLGDVVMSIPAISALCKSGREVHIVTRPHLAEVYALSGLPLTIHKIATKDNPLKVIKAMKSLAGIAGSAVTLPDSLRGAVLAKLCKTGKAIGFATQGRGLFLDKRVQKPKDFKLIHESKLHYMLIKEAIPELPEDLPRMPLCSFAFEDFLELADGLGIDGQKDFMLLAPGAAFGAAKRWPAEYFARLAKLIFSKYPQIQIVLTAGQNESEITKKILSESGLPLIDLAGKTSLKGLAVLLSRTKLLVANDSGTMHLGALYRTPTLVPVGPTDMVRTGALNENFTPIIAAGCEKIPCRQSVCPLKTDACMKSLTPELVFHFAQEILD